MAALRKSSLIPCAHIRVVDTRLSFKPLLHADTVSMRWGNRIQGPETPALTNQRMESVLLLYLSGERAYPSLEGNFPGHTHRHPLLFTHEGSVEEWKKCCIARVTLVRYWRYCWLDGGTNCGTSLGDAIILHTFSSIIPAGCLYLGYWWFRLLLGLSPWWLWVRVYCLGASHRAWRMQRNGCSEA